MVLLSEYKSNKHVIFEKKGLQLFVFFAIMIEN